jgi:hypothetical protein
MLTGRNIHQDQLAGPTVGVGFGLPHNQSDGFTIRRNLRIGETNDLVEVVESKSFRANRGGFDQLLAQRGWTTQDRSQE